MTERQYEQAQTEWATLDVKRCELMERHDADGDTFFENESWYAEYESISSNQNALLEQMDKHESIQAQKEFQSPTEQLEPGDYAWDHWQKWALEAGISKELAGLGRQLIREAALCANIVGQKNCETSVVGVIAGMR